MRRTIFVSFLLLGLTAIVLVSSRQAFPKDKLLFATGEEYFNREIAPGQITCPGGPCIPGSRMKMRERVAEYRYALQGSAANLFGSFLTATMNCNLDATMTGPCWGQFRWPLSEGEVWEGTWDGTFNFQTFVGSYRGVGHADGGTIEGLKCELETVYPGDREYPYGVISIRVH